MAANGRLTGGRLPDILKRIAGYVSLPFEKSYVSAEQVWTAGGFLSLTHGLGVVPTSVELELVCKIADYGHAVGTILCLGVQGAGYGTNNYGLVIAKTATNIQIRFGSITNPVVTIGTPDAGSTWAPVALTAGQWRLIVRARA